MIYVLLDAAAVVSSQLTGINSHVNLPLFIYQEKNDRKRGSHSKMWE